MLKTLVCSLLLASALSAQPAEIGRNKSQGNVKEEAANESTLPIATIRSSGGLILNGVSTPAGVNSVVIARGDVVETLSSSAVVTFRDGRVMNLAPGSKYGVSHRSGLPVAAGTSRTVNNPLQINSLSVRKP